jgi:fructokinase
MGDAMIVGIGELLWDIFPDGRKVAGGAPFNFAFHCHQLGHEAAIVSRVGDDDLGRELRDEVKRLGLSDAFIQTDRERPTGTVRVTVDANGQPSYEIVENVAWDFIDRESIGNDARAICFGTLAQRHRHSQSTIQDSIEGCRRGTLRVFDVNLRNAVSNHVLLKALDRSDWVKINDGELARLEREFALPMSTILGRETRQGNAGIDCCIVTRGEGGCEIVSRNESIEVPGMPANVVDTVGAGDAFTAAMVCLHLEGKPLRECARFANRYAANVCEHRGGTPRIDRRAIEALAAGG